MPENNFLFRKVTIIGVGLIGGSLGLGIKKAGLAQEVVGVARRHGPLVGALRSGAIDKISHDLPKAVQGADLVILAVPVKVIVGMMGKIARSLKRGCVVIDVGSTKVEIVDAAQKQLPNFVHFIGCHPMAGSEKKGALYGSADLFRDSICLLTPSEKTNPGVKDKVKDFWVRLGSSVKILSPEKHDQVLAYVSHLPHVLAYGLIRAVPPEFLEFASSGFKDTTRIGSSDPQMWSEICLANSRNIIKAVDECAKNLSIIRKAISSKNQQELIEIFRAAKTKRDELS